MIKVERIEAPPRPPATIRIELSEDQAQHLCALIGGVHYGTAKHSDSRHVLSALWAALDKALPGRDVCFSDLFKGQVEYR